MKEILSCTRKYLIYLLLSPIFIMTEVIMEVNIPRVMSKMVDIGIANKDIDIVLHYGLIMCGMAIISLIGGAGATYFSAKGGIGFGSELRKRVFDKIQSFSFENIDKFQQSSLITRLTTDVNFIQHGMMNVVRIFIRSPFMMIMAFVVAWQINTDLMKIFLLAIPVLVILIIVMARIALPKFLYMLTRFDSLNETVQEDLTNERVIKAYVREDYEKKRFGKINLDLMLASMDIENKLIMMQPIMMVIINSCIVAILWYGGNLIMVGDMLTGELISFISYVGQILSGLIMVAMIFITLVQLGGSVKRINEVLSEKVELTDGLYDYIVEEGSIDFNNVSFGYNGAAKESVKNIDLHIKAGETIGVIGSTGCGKTTLVSLIARLYDASEGEVLVSGHNVKDYKLKNLRDDVAMVLQQNVLFTGTIRENLKWGDLKASDEEIEEACKQASAHDFIMAFPDGYDTDLGQGGVNVSGGQKQRLCIARALIRKPKIIILDDSTSAVDTATDLKIRTALKEKLQGTTTIIIAQRVASVMEADRVVVLDKGEINEVNTPAQLLEHNAIYQDVYYTQLKGVE